MELIKVHGSGNDFFILDQEKMERRISEEELQQLAVRVCDRKNGFHGGADGILYVLPEDRPEVAGRMRVINADGSEASMCGNGLRTVARYLSEKTGRDEFRVATMYADLEVRRAEDLAEGVTTFAVEISPVSFKAADLKMHVGREELHDEIVPELSDTLRFSAVAVPNPHLISFVGHDTLVSDELGRIASYLNDGKNPLFPDGVNVSFVEILGEDSIFVRTYERGVGYTNACGTAMSASSLMYVLEKTEGRDFEKVLSVRNPGGMVRTVVHRRDDGSCWMSLIGNGTFVAKCSVGLDSALAGDFSAASWKETGEQEGYDRFIKSICG